jgi:hypothetical protein
MDAMKEQIHLRRLEAQENRHTHESRRQKRGHVSDLDKLKDKNKDTNIKISKDYRNQELTEKNKLEAKLIKLRRQNTDTIKRESERYESILSEMKAIHEGKVDELKISQTEEIDVLQDTHSEHLETARQKYEQELNKLEA